MQHLSLVLTPTQEQPTPTYTPIPTETSALDGRLRGGMLCPEFFLRGSTRILREHVFCLVSCLLAGGLIMELRENRGMRRVEVECYSGRVADERPMRFRLEGREYLVSEVLDQWYGPEHQYFKLATDDGGLYIRSHRTSVPDGDWELVSFREPDR